MLRFVSACVCSVGFFLFVLLCFVLFCFPERVKVNLVFGVDPQLEGHSSSELVPFVSGGNVVGVDLALDVDVLVGSYVQELDSDQWLRVVHLSGRGYGDRVNYRKWPFQTAQSGLKTLFYLSFLAIVRVVHQVKRAVRREVPQFSDLVGIFSLRGKRASSVNRKNRYTYERKR